jgi:penicillin-binding protein 1A
VAKKPSNRKAAAKTQRSSRWRRWLLWSGLAAFGILALICLTYAFWASTFDIEQVKQMRERSTVYDMDGKIYSRLQGENRIVVPVAEVSKNFRDASS